MARGTAPTPRHDRAVAVLQANAASLLRLARAHSLCADDAHDAYQRAVEIYLRRIDDVRDDTAGSWLRTVVKHEAMAVRAQRQRYVGHEEVDPDAWASSAGDGEERALAYERTTRAAEALQSCKRDEVAAMVLKADGHSYKEICSITGWSYTKVNRCLAEGRARFLERYAAIESGEECRRLAPLLSAIVDGEAREADMGDARRHLRNCPACRAALRELQDARTHIHAVLPLGGLAGAGVTGAGPWDTLVAAAHGLSLRLQAAVEATSVAKAGAVAASVAALAGGGAMTADRSSGAAPAPEPAVVASPATPRPAPTAVATAAPAPRGPSPSAAARPAQRRPRRRRAVREFGFEAAQPVREPAASPQTSQPSTGPQPRRRTPENFGFER